MALVAHKLPYLLIGILVVSVFTDLPLALVLSGGVAFVCVLTLGGQVQQHAQRRRPQR
ncbi:MAG TPA: hypothetical protein VFS21_06085 [Roseiflexaceae bacterium]|nr:hypothetical protein [Roseiflexaceae bacterium]